MRPNLSLESIAGALAVLGTGVIMAACGGDPKTPVNATEVPGATEKAGGDAAGHCGAGKDHKAGESGCAAAAKTGGDAKPADATPAAATPATTPAAATPADAKPTDAKPADPKAATPAAATTGTAKKPATPPAAAPAKKGGSGSCGAGTCGTKK